MVDDLIFDAVEAIEAAAEDVPREPIMPLPKQGEILGGYLAPGGVPDL